MSNLALRLLVFALGLPAVVLSAFAFPQFDYPLFALLVAVASALAANEAAQFFTAGPLRYPGRAIVIPGLGAILPVVTYGYIRGMWTLDLISMVVVGASSAILFVQILRRKSGEFVDILPAVVSHVFILIYPGLFASYAMRLLLLPDASKVILVFFLSIYLNDSLAYVMGRLFGRKKSDTEEAIVPVSPNKSIAGFLGGMAATAIVVFSARYLWPEGFSAPAFRLLIFSLVIGIGTIAGDLVESALKRSAALKDSGTLIPGRGGILDSVDSPLFTAPLFYYAYQLLIHGGLL